MIQTRLLLNGHRLRSYATSSTLGSLLGALRGKTAGAARVTQGLSDRLLERFAANKDLIGAVQDASAVVDDLIRTHGQAAVVKDELQLASDLQGGFVNFYDPSSVMPCVSAAGRGPWVVTVHGAVLHDNGGYGMLGFGHNANFLTAAVAKPQVMANVMTPCFSQAAFYTEWRKQVGFSRKDGCPYSHIMTMNSGSESVELSARLTDVHAKLMTDPNAVHAGRKSVMIVLEGSFYGRTYRPARLSHSCRPIYQRHLASFQHDECHLPIVVPANDIKALEQAFAGAEAKNLHVEAMYMEPVMGEGNPGEAVDRAFYDAARRLTKEHHSLLIVDSIQAALRAKGTLSIVDYPGFSDAEAPDMETYSKALNAGQFPLSVLAMQSHVASKYAVGLYGNTMTSNPRGLDVATEVLKAVTPAVRQNIVNRGVEFQEKFGALCRKHPSILHKVTGSGLLQAVHLRPSIPMFGGNQAGTKSFLAACRHAGIGVINAAHTIKYTSHFNLTSAEIDLLVDALDDVCKTYTAIAPSK
eukprot:m.118502 g.118502  ORF g.118502 m.118502 type:complete len:525 (-) comp52016_c0_seq4:104-1678(-)